MSPDRVGLMLSSRFAVPGHDLPRDRSIATRPHATSAVRPPRVLESVQEELDVKEACALVKPPSKSVYLLAALIPEDCFRKRFPRRGEEITELHSPVGLPPPAPVG